MKELNGLRRMTREEMLELMRRKNWTRARLADECGVGQNAVDRWFSDREPSGSASKLMHIYLREARGEIKIVELKPAKRPVAI